MLWERECGCVGVPGAGPPAASLLATLPCAQDPPAANAAAAAADIIIPDPDEGLNGLEPPTPTAAPRAADGAEIEGAERFDGMDMDGRRDKPKPGLGLGPGPPGGPEPEGETAWCFA